MYKRVVVLAKNLPRKRTLDHRRGTLKRYSITLSDAHVKSTPRKSLVEIIDVEQDVLFRCSECPKVH